MKMTVNEAIEKANAIAHSGNINITLGMERRAVAKEWNGTRVYINIYCYTLAGNYKGKYDCGYIDKATDEYVVTKYTEIDLASGEWVGR